MNKENKNHSTLLSFEGYCCLHPEERFWQCLRNWNKIKNPKQNFILTAELSPNIEQNWTNEEDTFYKE